MDLPATMQQELINIFADAGIAVPGQLTYKGKPVFFSIDKRENLYLHFEDARGVWHCYTPHPSTDGDYFVFDYVPKGDGSRTGKATRYTMRDIVRCASRKTAKSKAVTRCDKGQIS